MSDEFDIFYQKGPIQILKPTNTDSLQGRVRAMQHLLQREKPIHRAIIERVGSGMTHKEAAMAVGVTRQTVQNVIAQPMLQRPLIESIRRQHGADEKVVEIIKESVVEAVQTLAGIIRDDKAKNSDRIAACESLLNRRYGKPNQPINRGTDVDLNTLSDQDLVKMLPN